MEPVSIVFILICILFIDRVFYLLAGVVGLILIVVAGVVLGLFSLALSIWSWEIGKQ